MCLRLGRMVAMAVSSLRKARLGRRRAIELLCPSYTRALRSETAARGRRPRWVGVSRNGCGLVMSALCSTRVLLASGAPSVTPRVAGLIGSTSGSSRSPHGNMVLTMSVPLLSPKLSELRDTALVMPRGRGSAVVNLALGGLRHKPGGRSPMSSGVGEIRISTVLSPVHGSSLFRARGKHRRQRANSCMAHRSRRL